MEKKHLSQRLSFTGLVFMLGLVISPEVLADNNLNLNSNQLKIPILIQTESISIPIEKPSFIQPTEYQPNSNQLEIPILIQTELISIPVEKPSFIQPTEYQPISQPISLDVYYEPINYSQNSQNSELVKFVEIEPYNPNSLIMMENDLISNSSCSTFDNFPFPTGMGSGIGYRLLMISYNLKKANCDYERSMNELRRQGK